MPVEVVAVRCPDCNRDYSIAIMRGENREARIQSFQGRPCELCGYKRAKAAREAAFAPVYAELEKLNARFFALQPRYATQKLSPTELEEFEQLSRRIFELEKQI